MSTAGEEQGLGTPVYCKNTDGSIRLILKGSSGPNRCSEIFMGTYTNAPDDPMTPVTQCKCFTDLDGAGTYFVIFDVTELMPEASYEVTVVFSGGSHIYLGEWPTTPIGNCVDGTHRKCDSGTPMGGCEGP